MTLCRLRAGSELVSDVGFLDQTIHYLLPAYDLGKFNIVIPLFLTLCNG